MTELYPVSYIYALCDPDTGYLRYIGKAENPQKRLNNHISESLRSNFCRRHHWIVGLVRAGLTPTLIILEEVQRHEWVSAEQFWIASMRIAGCDLVNGSDGGEGNKNCRLSVITRQRMSAAKKGRPLTPAHRVSLTGCRLGYKHTKESLKKMSDAHKGQKLPEGHVFWGGLHGEAHGFFGKHHTDETKAKISAAKMGRPSLLKGVPRDPKHFDSLRKTYICIDPDGVEHITPNLPQFCRDHNLTRSNLITVLSGKWKHHKGWRIRRPA